MLFNQNWVTVLIIHKVIDFPGLNLAFENNLTRLIAGRPNMRRNHCAKTMRTCRDKRAWLHVDKQWRALSLYRGPVDLDNRKI